MKKELTNKLNLPAPVVAAVRRDDYSRGEADLSVTQLLSPPRVIKLKEQHADDIENDAADLIYTLMGQMTHRLLERAIPAVRIREICKDLQRHCEPEGFIGKNCPEIISKPINQFVIALLDVCNKFLTGKGWLVEERLFVDIDGLTVSGQIDLFNVNSGQLDDYKTGSIWKFKDGICPEEYEQQINIYAYMLRQKGYTVKHGRIVAILRDWSARKAKFEKGCPPNQVITVAVPLWTEEKCLTFIKERVRIHKAAQQSLPDCTDDDRWFKPEKFAVMRVGDRKAIRLYSTQAEAQTRIDQEMQNDIAQLDAGTLKKLPKYRIRHDLAENVRCENYCEVAAFCSQFKKLKGEN